MSKPLFSWAFRDLETMIAWLSTASTHLAEIENDPNLSRTNRELASDARTSVKGALMLAKEIRSASEDIQHNGEASTTPEP